MEDHTARVNRSRYRGNAMTSVEERARMQRRAVAHLYHTLFTGLILTVVTRRSAADAAAWIEALFRKQHHAKFLSSFEKLGLGHMPPAVAAAAYHYHSNRIGGVDVEFMQESDRKAWVRFPPPRWIYPGATICGVPSEVSRAMLRGWYAENGRSLGVPGLQFVCTGQTMDTQSGLMGYFIEHDQPVAEDERLIFRPGEIAPAFDASRAPNLPEGEWPPERLEKARRNYAMEYHRTGIPLLFSMFGVAEAHHLLRTACWLVGAQLSREIAGMLGETGEDEAALIRILEHLVNGEGDHVETESLEDGSKMTRIGLGPLNGTLPQPPEATDAWSALFLGIASGHNRFNQLRLLHYHGEKTIWKINPMLIAVN